MATPKIVLFYRFTPLADPEAIRLWQHTLAASNNLTGRILISEHGINATVGGDIADVKRYVRGTRSYAPFSDADIKWSDGTGSGVSDFPRLSVRVRPEIVTFGVPGEVKVDADGIVGGGTHLSPNELHELVEQRGDDVVFFDGRNAFEAEIGRFRNAVVPDVSTTRDFVAALDSGRYDHLKSKPVVTYCTGGVRCEVLSALMRGRGFDEVYQLDGGIVRYGEAFGDEGLWEGSLYVFDKRMNVDFTDKAIALGRCTLCQAPTSRYRNYPDEGGRELTLVCQTCVPDA
ncbi:rhodanese-related sulfurtransferase [Rhodococcus sp. ABRD24]|uniref:oxygen-dependent tRNA uridine(34) hydroxylase TrhO n=1 Tax=Rhodococcus sp. ABRD24 TaxID=2507582 RepID=UPI00103DBB19|nr:rhodanese-related sulfurtransferase [Rhodococcus sp. ABRD24]QBJ94535.1 rhodanese-related sulfurtransferase [Rhodococcus sp. ABRD24]